MFYSTLLIAATAFTGLVSAQNYSTSGPLSIDVTQIDSSLRNSWCVAERSTCPAICGGNAFPNECNSETLDYTCECTDGSTPNISDYRNTIPFFICQQWKINCVANHPDDIEGQGGCLSVKCGNTNATTGSAASASASGASPSGTGSSGGSGGASASASGSASSTGGGGAQSTTTDGAAVMNVAQNYGTSIVVAGLLALFGLGL